MFWLQSCPKCSGDLYEDRDQYGTYVCCIQCGQEVTAAEEVLLRYMSRPRASSSQLKAANSSEVVGAGKQ
jgi:DNA-directed RNA polymerase subunit M/transcription elongation factor TFIIS